MATTKKPARRAPVGKKPARRAPVRWSDARERLFFQALAETANVSRSATAAGMHDQAAYKRRQTDPEFRSRWLAALRDGYARIELLLLEKALTGTLNPVNDRVLLALLVAHRGTVRAIDAAEPGPGAPAGDRLKAQLDKMADRVGNQA